MGVGANEDFHVEEKLRVGWLTDDEIVTNPDGVYRLYASDQGHKVNGSTYGLRIADTVGPGLDRNYVVEYRPAISWRPGHASDLGEGVLLTWDSSPVSISGEGGGRVNDVVVIDASPGSQPTLSTDQHDRILRPGSVFYDELDGIQIEVLRLGREGFQPTVRDYADVRVTRLPTFDSDPPSIHPGQDLVSYKYFEGTWSQIPNFDVIPFDSEGTTNGFNLDLRQQDDEFGFRFEATVFVPQSGNYQFTIGSDDGSRLYVDDRLVADNDGLHGIEFESGSRFLSAGAHDLRIDYFERTGGEFLQATIEGPGIPRSNIENHLGFQTTITEQSDESAEFAVIYTDYLQVDASTIRDGNLEVVAADGTELPVELKIRVPNFDTPAILSRYEILPPSGQWRASDNGEYLVRLKSNEVTDTTGNAARVQFLGKLTVDIESDDAIAPEANLTSNTSITSPTVSHRIEVEYSDANGINSASIGAGDLRVAGPNGIQPDVIFDRIVSTSATTVIASYLVRGPDGSWDAGDPGGIYEVWMQPNQVEDSFGNPVPGEQIGVFLAIIGDTNDGRIVFAQNDNLRLVSVPETNPTLAARGLRATKVIIETIDPEAKIVTFTGMEFAGDLHQTWVLEQSTPSVPTPGATFLPEWVQYDSHLLITADMVGGEGGGGFTGIVETNDASAPAGEIPGEVFGVSATVGLGSIAMRTETDAFFLDVDFRFNALELARIVIPAEGSATMTAEILGTGFSDIPNTYDAIEIPFGSVDTNEFVFAQNDHIRLLSIPETNPTLAARGLMSTRIVVETIDASDKIVTFEGLAFDGDLHQTWVFGRSTPTRPTAGATFLEQWIQYDSHLLVTRDMIGGEGGGGFSGIQETNDASAPAGAIPGQVAGLSATAGLGPIRMQADTDAFFLLNDFQANSIELARLVVPFGGEAFMSANVLGLGFTSDATGFQDIPIPFASMEQLPGDINLDGCVDSIDLNIIGLFWNTEGNTRAEGDLTGDGVVDARDLNVIGLYWQQCLQTNEPIVFAENEWLRFLSIPERNRSLEAIGLQATKIVVETVDPTAKIVTFAGLELSGDLHQTWIVGRSTPTEPVPGPTYLEEWIQYDSHLLIDSTMIGGSAGGGFAQIDETNDASAPASPIPGDIGGFTPTTGIGPIRMRAATDAFFLSLAAQKNSVEIARLVVPVGGEASLTLRRLLGNGFPSDTENPITWNQLSVPFSAAEAAQAATADTVMPEIDFVRREQKTFDRIPSAALPASAELFDIVHAEPASSAPGPPGRHSPRPHQTTRLRRS